jgi:hypothetical protein
MAINKTYQEYIEKGLLDDRQCASFGNLDGPEGNGMAALLVCGDTLRIFPMNFRGIADEPIAEYDLNDVMLVKYRKGILKGAFGLLTFSANGCIYRLTDSSNAEALAGVMKRGDAVPSQGISIREILLKKLPEALLFGLGMTAFAFAEGVIGLQNIPLAVLLFVLASGLYLALRSFMEWLSLR